MRETSTGRVPCSSGWGLVPWGSREGGPKEQSCRSVGWTWGRTSSGAAGGVAGASSRTVFCWADCEGTGCRGDAGNTSGRPSSTGSTGFLSVCTNSRSRLRNRGTLRPEGLRLLSRKPKGYGCTILNSVSLPTQKEWEVKTFPLDTPKTLVL